MIKGCEKRVVWLRNTESEVFDQAYFILSESAYEKKHSETDIVAEAKRIIARSPFTGYWDDFEQKKRKKRRMSSASLKWIFFVLGFSAGSLPLAITLLIL